MKEVEFKFNRSTEYQISKITDHYQAIIKDYLKLVFNKDKNPIITPYFLNDINKVDGKFIKNIDEYSIIDTLFPYFYNCAIVCKLESGEDLFEFYMYNQNNCCGAVSVSKTFVNENYRDRKLGTILQYLKEDIAYYKPMYMMTCTDVYYLGFNNLKENIADIKPYLPNTKVLLNTGWEISKLFYNGNSNNIVALYTKVLKERKLINNEVVMKIRIDEDKLVNIENVTIGGDPEGFFRNKETKEYIPSFYVMKGNKNKPVKITEDGHALSCDNVMWEYNFPPCKTAEQFIKENQISQDYLKSKIADPNNLELVIYPAAEFTETHLVSPKAKEFGCDPDFNVWSGGKPNTVGNGSGGLRTAGGHIQLGYDNHTRVTNNYIIKAMDLFLSVPLVLMEPNNRRKEMYGKAGAFRPQPWGVEYRSTSNYIYSTPELMEWAFNQTLKAIEFVNDPVTRVQLDIKAGSIIDAINDKDVKIAKDLIEKYQIKVLETVVV